MNTLKLLFGNVLEICLLITIISMIYMTIMGIDITEPQKTIAVMIVSAFFWRDIPKGLSFKSDTNGA